MLSKYTVSSYAGQLAHLPLCSSDISFTTEVKVVVVELCPTAHGSINKRGYMSLAQVDFRAPF